MKVLVGFMHKSIMKMDFGSKILVVQQALILKLIMKNN